MPDSIFSKIIRGEIPSRKIYEDEHVFAFLDINPLATGHTLVIPKREVELLHELPADEAAAIARVLGMLGRQITEAVGAAGYNVLQNNGPEAGQVVPHVHFHIIPRAADDGLGYRWNVKPTTQDELAATHERILIALA